VSVADDLRDGDHAPALASRAPEPAKQYQGDGGTAGESRPWTGREAERAAHTRRVYPGSAARRQRLESAAR
jgi:hypothetical protein